MYSTKKYREATTKKEQCKVPLKPDWGSNQDQMTLEKLRKEYHEYCPKSKSSNIVFCPEKIIKRKKDKKVQWINEYFKHFGKKNDKKRRGEKKKKKKKKKLKYTKNNGKDYRQNKKKSKSNTIEIKEKVKNIKDKLNIKLDDININVKHDIGIKHDINIKLDDKLDDIF